MGDFLTAVKTVSLSHKARHDQAEDHLREVSPAAKPLIQAERVAVTSPDIALEILRSQPDIDALEDVLVYLSRRQNHNGFNIRVPSPSSAKIVNELITTTIPHFWSSLDGLKQLLVDTLRSVAGISAIVARLRLLISQHQPSKKELHLSTANQPILELIDVLSELCSTEVLSRKILADIRTLVDSQAKQDLLWKEYLATVASGKITSTVAQAEDITNTNTSSLQKKSWLSDGALYSAWLGRNIVQMLQHDAISSDHSAAKPAAQLCGKAFTIGYAARIVEEIHVKISLSHDHPMSDVHRFIENLQTFEQRQFLLLTMKFLSKRSPEVQALSPDLGSTSKQVLCAAALLKSLLFNQSMKDLLVSWLSDPGVNSAESFSMRRAAIAALASMGGARSVIDEDPIQNILESNWKLFGDNLFIKHTPIIQQEACAQVLLLTTGYVHRTQPMFLFTLARSSLHLNGVSNRLNASSPRARFLGMMVGMAISSLVDKEGSALTFDVEETKTPEAQWYQQLIKVNDQIGSIEEMRNILSAEQGRIDLKVVPLRKSSANKAPKKPAPVTQTTIQGPRIMEILDDDEEDDDLVPYAKPDSDPEDDDDDPTLVNRDKPKAPVYVRDLIAGLHDTENHDRHTLALKTAASLIRRKSSFGKEVSDHAIELALILIGLGNTFDLEDFAELRLQALIAILLSNPAQLAPWFARQVFDGEYSLSQRATILSVLGLGARELAGYKDEDEDLNPKISEASFPSKQLPERLHKIYAGDSSDRTALIASKLEKSFIQPLAARAADDLSGPNILKVRTFSSRMEVEKKRKKPISNALAKIVADSFFFPLTGRWWQTVQAYGAAASSNVHFQPFLLTTYLKTLAILLHASGPNTLSLPQMTAEFWELLLSVRAAALADVAVLEAVLFCFVTLLEVNEDKRRLAEEHGKELMETQGWAELVFEKSNGGGGDAEGERIRMLSASVLVKTRDVVEKFQRLLVGNMLDY